MEVFLVGLVAATLRVSNAPDPGDPRRAVLRARAGVLDLGIEGTMFLGAFVGFVVADVSGSLWLGVLAAVVAGVASGLLMSPLAVRLGANQHVSGLGITLLLTGLSLFAYRLIYPERQVLAAIPPFGKISALRRHADPWAHLRTVLVDLPGGSARSLAWWVLYRTNFGLQVRAVGENPEAADAAGVNAFLVRYLSLAIAGGLMGAAGSFLSLGPAGRLQFRHRLGAGLGVHRTDRFWELGSGEGPVGCLAVWRRLCAAAAAADHRRRPALRVLPGAALPDDHRRPGPGGPNAAYPAALLKPYRRE